MGKEIQILDNPLIKNLQQGITQAGNFDVQRVDKLGLNIELKKYKDKNGSIDFVAMRDIPEQTRIYAVAQQDLGQTVKIIAVALTLAFESMNLTRPMNAIQILDLAEMIVEESESDKLAFQDVLLFLQKLTRGHYPGLYEGIDAVKFMERFNQYRDERFQEFIRLRDEREEYYKRLGDDNGWERNNTKDASPLGMQLEHYKQKVQARKDEVQESKRYRK